MARNEKFGARLGLICTALALVLITGSGLTVAAGSGTSQCTAPAGGNCTQTFNLNQGESVSGNFTSDQFVRLFVTDPAGSLVHDSGGVVSSDSFNIKANSTGNYVFTFDNHMGDVPANITLDWTHHVPSVPQFPGQLLFAGGVVLVVVMSYSVLRTMATKREESRF